MKNSFIILVFITSDMKYMFFASSRKSPALKPLASGVEITDLLTNLTEPGNGLADIYWISTEIIKELKPSK